MNALSHVIDGGSGATLDPKSVMILNYLMEHANSLHKRDAICEVVGAQAGGRTVDTHISAIRKALGGYRDQIIVAHGAGAYGWIGDPVTLVPVVRTAARPPSNDPMARYAVMSQDEVAKRLGLAKSTVRLLERRALAKLRRRPDLQDAWREMLSQKSRVHFDPFYEVWLFSVQETIASPYKEDKEEEVE